VLLNSKSTTWDRPKNPVRVAFYHTPMLNQVLNVIHEYEDAMLEAARYKYVHILTAAPKVLILNSLS
jgi:hypothetical protein